MNASVNMRMDVSVSGVQVSAEVSGVGSVTATATASAGGIQIGGAFVERFSFAYCNILYISLYQGPKRAYGLSVEQ